MLGAAEGDAEMLGATELLVGAPEGDAEMLGYFEEAAEMIGDAEGSPGALSLAGSAWL